MKSDPAVIEKVGHIYRWLLSKTDQPSADCQACGKSCDFQKSDHRLFVTPPELMYLAGNLGVEELRPMPTGLCPYNIDSKCDVYPYRFAGCRIFSCKGDADIQSQLSEEVLSRLKSICTDFQLPYRYSDLPAALNTWKNDS